jgi:hypothetical protein
MEEPAMNIRSVLLAALVAAGLPHASPAAAPSEDELQHWLGVCDRPQLDYWIRLCEKVRARDAALNRSDAPALERSGPAPEAPPAQAPCPNCPHPATEEKV